MKKLLVSLIAISCLQFVVSSYAQVPGIINYQGRVVDNGTNFDGTGQFEFALVDGTGTTNYWSNDGTAAGQPALAVSLTVTKGLYSVLLGDTTITNMTVAVPAAVFANSNVLLRVWFNDSVTGFQQLIPDQRIAAAGYALVAATVPAGVITAALLASNAIVAANLLAPLAAQGVLTNGEGGLSVGSGSSPFVLGTNSFSGTSVTVYSNYTAFSFTDTRVNGTYVLTNRLATLAAAGVPALWKLPIQGNTNAWLFPIWGGTNNSWIIVVRAFFSPTSTNSLNYWTTNGLAGPWYSNTVQNAGTVGGAANPVTSTAPVAFPNGATGANGVPFATNSMTTFTTGCCIMRGGSNLNYGFNITAWAAAITNGDYAMIVGGSYALTNYNFRWQGMPDSPNGTVIQAVHPQILMVYTTPDGLPGGYATPFLLNGASNLTLLGDWNVTEIAGSSYLTNAQNYQFLSCGTAGFSPWRVTVDGMRGVIMQTNPPNTTCCGTLKPLVFVGVASHGVVIKNCQIGARRAWPGGVTNGPDAGLSSDASAFITAHGNNPDITEITLIDDVFYGDVYPTGIDHPECANIHNCYMLDERNKPNLDGSAYSFAPFGTLDTNENEAYFPPTVPLQNSPIPWATSHSMPPDQITNLVASGFSPTLSGATFTNISAGTSLPTITNGLPHGALYRTNVNGAWMVGIIP